MERGLLVNVIARAGAAALPPLTVSDEEIEHGVCQVLDAGADCRRSGGVVKSAKACRAENE